MDTPITPAALSHFRRGLLRRNPADCISAGATFEPPDTEVLDYLGSLGDAVLLPSMSDFAAFKNNLKLHCCGDDIGFLTRVGFRPRGAVERRC